MPQKSLVKWFESWGCNPLLSVYIGVLTSYPICQTLLKPFQDEGKIIANLKGSDREGGYL